MRVELIRPESLGTPDREAWASWQQAESRLANPFMSGTFAVLASRYIEGASVAVVHEPSGPVAFWPLHAGRRTVRPVVPGFTDLQGLVHDPGWSWDWRRLLVEMPVAGARFDHLVGYQATGYPGFRMHESPRVEFAEGWDRYFTDLRSGHRRMVKDSLRRHHRAQDEFKVEFTDSDVSGEALTVLMHQKSAQCRENGWVDVFGSPDVRQLVGSAALSKEPDLTGRLSTLRYDGAIVAVRLMIDAFGSRCAWISSYDPNFSWYRPGWNLLLLSLEAAARAGCSSFSLGKGNERYKSLFATGADLVGAGSVPGGGVPGRLFSASRLPSKALELGFERSPNAEEVVRRGVRRLRKWRYRFGTR